MDEFGGELVPEFLGVEVEELCVLCFVLGAVADALPEVFGGRGTHFYFLIFFDVVVCICYVCVVKKGGK